MFKLVQVDAHSVCTAFLHDVEPLPQPLYLEQLQRIGATPASLQGDARLLREWLAQQPHLPQLGEEYDPWLIRFLIGSKNSLKRCKEFLEKYFTVRALRPQMFSVEPSPVVDEVFRILRVGLLPKVTPQGSRVVMFKFTKAVGDEPSLMNWAEGYKVGIQAVELAMAALGHPVHFEICFDLEYYSMALNNSFIANMGSFRSFVQTVQGSYPLRYKAVHLLNAPGIIKAVIAVVRPFVKDKVADRIVVHEDYESFRRSGFIECLPSDYGGKAGKTLSQMNDDWNLTFHSSVPWFRERQKKLVADESKRVGGPMNGEIWTCSVS